MFQETPRDPQHKITLSGRVNADPRLPRTINDPRREQTIFNALVQKFGDVVDYYINRLPDPDKLFEAAEEYLDCVKASGLSQQLQKKLVNFMDPDLKTTLFHILAEYDTPSYLWAKGCSMGFRPNLRNGDGNTVLMIAAAAGHENFIHALTKMQARGYDFNIKDKSERSVFDIAFSNGNLDQAQQIINCSQSIRRTLNREIIFEDEGKNLVEITKRNAFDKIYEFYVQNDQGFFARFKDFIQTYGNMENALSYVNSFVGILGITDSNVTFDGNPFIRLFPKLYTSYSYDQIDDILNEFERMMDSPENEDLHGLPHPNTAEFLGMLSHGKRTEDFNTLTRALSSPYRLIDNGSDTVGETTAYAWLVTGILGYSFKQLKFDCMRPLVETGQGIVHGKAIIEHYGAHRADLKEASKLGAAYYLLGSEKDCRYDLDYMGLTISGKDTVLVFLRGGILACTDEGSVFIRNSSKEFGRDLLDHPVYVSEEVLIPAGLSHEEIQRKISKLTPEWIEKHMIHMLDKDLYANKQEKFQKYIRIIGQIYLFWKDYRTWQCDMDPRTSIVTDDDGKSFKVGGHKSPGFQHTVDLLIDLYVGRNNIYHNHPHLENGMPVLSWYVPHLIPFQPYASLDIGKDQLRALKCLRSRSETAANKELIYSSGVFDFLNVGYAKQASLMIEEKRWYDNAQ